MITIKEKLFVTTDINLVLYNYAKEIVLRELLYLYSFENNSRTDDISQLIQDINHCNGITPLYEEQVQLSELIHNFVENLASDKQVALNFWVLNNLYLEFLDKREEEETDEEKNDTEQQFYQKFGRDLAYKLYDQKNSGLKSELHDSLMDLLITFASEMDFSLIDESSSDHIVDIINMYCKHKTTTDAIHFFRFMD